MRPRTPIAGMILMYIAGVLTGLFIGWVQDLRKKVVASERTGFADGWYEVRPGCFVRAPGPYVCPSANDDGWLNQDSKPLGKVFRDYEPPIPLKGGAVNIPGRIKGPPFLVFGMPRDNGEWKCIGFREEYPRGMCSDFPDWSTQKPTVKDSGSVMGVGATWKITRYCWAYGEDDLCKYGPQMPLGGGAVNVPGRIIPFDDRGYACYTGGQCVAILSETDARARRVMQWAANPIVVKPPDGLPVIPSITFATK